MSENVDPRLRALLGPAGPEITCEECFEMLDVFVDAAELANRPLTDFPADAQAWTGTGRELFASLRRAVGPADRGASVFGPVAASHFEGRWETTHASR